MSPALVAVEVIGANRGEPALVLSVNVCQRVSWDQRLARGATGLFFFSLCACQIEKKSYSAVPTDMRP